ncbi:icarapin-like [Ptiloglossa arizonensis]|uniref:icarapin-like n=1 Tax=Ptiloglossa arizonensis TaxID=3350558 RepID=UPI003FA15D7E
MKTFGGVLLVAACFVACTHSFPGAFDFDSRELLNRSTFDIDDMGFDDSEEMPTWSWSSLFRSHPLDGFYSSMQNIMKRWREQMAGILSRIPEQGVVPWSKIPDGANTTSTTKVINGHVVTINETTYVDGDDTYGSLIRVRIIDVKPQNETILLTESEADAEVTTLPTTVTSATSTLSSEDRTTGLRSVETVEEFDNEIPKNQVDTLTA